MKKDSGMGKKKGRFLANKCGFLLTKCLTNVFFRMVGSPISRRPRFPATVLFSGLGWESDKVHKKTKRGGKKAGQFHGRPGKKSRAAPPEPLAEGMCRGGGCSGGAGAPEAGGKLTNRGAEWVGPRGQGRRPVRGKKRGSMEKINRKSLQFLRRCVAISQGIQYNNRKSFSG